MLFSSPQNPGHRRSQRIVAALLLATSALVSGVTWAHGDVTPQAVDIGDLPKLGAEWRSDNPYSKNDKAIKIGASAYNQNCARCHGLEAVSGGIAPDLRKLDKDCTAMTDAKKQAACVKEVNEYYVSRFRRGVTRNGAVYMPPFEGVISQEGAWTIKTYLESRREKPLVATK